MRSALAFILLAVFAAPSRAHDLSFDECLEGSEFILHAAMSRDSGMTREDFIGRVHADLQAIQQFPAEFRWFAQDEDDARMLIVSSEKVFDVPRSPETHQSEFLQTCIGAMSTDASTRAGPRRELETATEDTVKESGL